MLQKYCNGKNVMMYQKLALHSEGSPLVSCCILTVFLPGESPYDTLLTAPEIPRSRSAGEVRTNYQRKRVAVCCGG